MSATRRGNNPLYMELAAQLRNSIENGTYKKGDRMPSEPDLCETTGYSRSTVRKALEMLVEEGYVTKSQGKGTFVKNEHAFDERATQSRTHFTGFTENAREMGAIPSTRTVDFRTVVPSPEVAQFFGLDEGETAIELCRLRLADGMPVSVETTWLPNRFANLEQGELDGSIYELFRSLYGIEAGAGTKSFGLCYADHRDAFLLNVPLGAPLVLAQDCVHDKDGHPLHVTNTATRDDRYRYSISI